MSQDAELVQGAGMVGLVVRNAAIGRPGLREVPFLMQPDGGGDHLGEDVHRDAGPLEWG
jgi:hypothetical protein